MWQPTLHSVLGSLIKIPVNKIHFQNTILAFSNCLTYVWTKTNSEVASESIYEWRKPFTILMVLTILFRTLKRSPLGMALQSCVFIEN